MHERFSYAACVHFRSTSSACHKGVDPKDVTDKEGRMPCVSVRGVTGEIACDMRLMPADAPAGTPGPATEMLNAMLEGKCPTCKREIAGEMEFNGAILAMPCRHVIRPARD